MPIFHAYTSEKVPVEGTKVNTLRLTGYLCCADSRGESILKASDELKRQYGGAWRKVLEKCVFMTEEELASKGIENPYKGKTT